MESRIQKEVVDLSKILNLLYQTRQGGTEEQSLNFTSILYFICKVQRKLLN